MFVKVLILSAEVFRLVLIELKLNLFYVEMSQDLFLFVCLIVRLGFFGTFFLTKHFLYYT